MFNVKVNELSYDEFMKDLNGGKVTELTITPKVRTETYMLEGKLSDYAENESFILYLPQSEEFISKITAAKEGTSNFELKSIQMPKIILACCFSRCCSNSYSSRRYNLDIHKTTWWRK